MGMIGGAEVGGDGARTRATQISASGPLGATRVQEALDLIAAAGPYWTTEQNPALVLASSPNWTTLKLFTISSGTTRHLEAKVRFAGGTTLLPTGAAFNVLAMARRTAGGTTTAPSPVIQTTEALTGLATRWQVIGTDVALQARASGGPTVRMVLLYNWIEVLPP